jgi:Zn-dependent peptidase ImmA (M78 family)
MVERISNVNWRRIEWCCAERRITLDDLAVAAGVPLASLERLESGEDSLTFHQLHRIASFLGRGVLFFLEPGDVDAVKVFTTGFRTLASQKAELDSAVKRIVERAEWQREAYISLRENVDYDEVAEFSPPDLRGKSPEKAALLIRNWLQLDGVRTFDGFRQAVEHKGILVFRTNGYQGKWQVPKSSPILGFAIFHDRFPLVVVRKTRFESRQAFTLFHELAHILLHKESVIDDETDLAASTGKEREANRFAACVLVPDALLRAIDTSTFPSDVSLLDNWLKPIKSASGASTEVVLLRLVEAERLKHSVYERFKEWQSSQQFEEDDGGARLYRYREPRHILGDSYVRAVLTALEQRRITLTKASKFLDGLKVSDLHKLENFCASH